MDSMGSGRLEAEVARRLRATEESKAVVESVASVFWNMAREAGLAPAEEAAFRASVVGLMADATAREGHGTLPRERGLSARGEAMLFLLFDWVYGEEALGGGTFQVLTNGLEEGDREALGRAWPGES